MKIKSKFAMFVTVCSLLFLSLSVAARAANSPEYPEKDQGKDQGSTQTQSEQKVEEQKDRPGPGKEVGKGGEDVGKGAGKGAESLGKGTAGAAGNLVTLHPGHAATDLGKGAAGAGKDVGVGAGKSAAKIGSGSARGIGKLGRKMFGRGKKKNSDVEN
jgi:hypothetical protein